MFSDGHLLDSKLFGKKYLQYEDGNPQPALKANDTTIRQWLVSIEKGYNTEAGDTIPKDHLSPPDGYEVFEPAYSMGAKGMDGDLVLIEVRNHGDSSNLPAEQWPDAPEMLLNPDVWPAPE